MEDKEILSRIERVLKEDKNMRNKKIFGIPKKISITPETKLQEAQEGINLDPFDRYEFLYRIEEEFGITIPDEKANEFDIVKKYLDYVKAHINENSF